MTSRVALTCRSNLIASGTARRSHFVTTTLLLHRPRNGTRSRKPTELTTEKHIKLFPFLTSIRLDLDLTFSLEMSSEDGGKHSPMAVVSFA